MNSTSKIYIAGHRGMVGSAIYRHLSAKGYTNIITKEFSEMDLRSQVAVKMFFESERPDYVFLAAAKVGGIYANNTYPADFIYDNLMIQNNIIHQAYVNGTKKLLFLGSSCIYPKMAQQPIREDYLLTGPLEPTNEAYAIAKIAGVKMCQAYNQQFDANFIAVMPTNLYGPNDNYDLSNSHVLPALIRKFYEAKINGLSEVTVWGTGTPRREFLHVNDLADACIFLMNNYDGKEPVNIGVGVDISIAELASLVGEVVGYSGEIVFDKSMPDGTPRKWLDVSLLRSLGWKHTIPLIEGIRQTYSDFLKSSFANYNKLVA